MNEQSPLEQVDHIAVNKYMLSLGFRWNDYDKKWFKHGNTISQYEAARMYISSIEQPNTNKDISELSYNEWFSQLIKEVYPTEPGMLNIGLLNKRIANLIQTSVQEARIDELSMAYRLNEQKELDPVIHPHTPYRMRAWFKDRINQLKDSSKKEGE